jgi:biotin carboxyl carrier protein
VDLTEIRKIMKLMDEHGLSQFQYEKEDFNLKLKKGNDLEEIQKLIASVPSGGGPVAAPVPAAASAVATAPDGGTSDGSSGEAISSPMVGTFYQLRGPH